MMRLTKLAIPAAKTIADSLKIIRKPDVRIESRISAFEALKKMGECRGMTEKDFGILMADLYKFRDRRIIQVFTDMKKNKIHPNEYHYFLLFGVVELPELVKMFKYLLKQRLLTCNLLSMILHRILQQDKPFGAFLDLWNAVRNSSEFTLDEMNLCYFLKGFQGRAELIGSVHQFLKRPTELAISTLISAYSSVNEHERVLGLYRILSTLKQDTAMNGAVFGFYLRAISALKIVVQVDVQKLPTLADDSYKTLFELITFEQNSVKLHSCLGILKSKLSVGPSASNKSNQDSICLSDRWVRKEVSAGLQLREPSPPTISAAEYLLLAATELPKTENLYDYFQFYKNIRRRETNAINHSSGLPLGAKEWIDIFRNQKLKNGCSVIPRYRQWRPPYVPRSILAAVAGFYARQRNSVALIELFQSEVFLGDWLELYWTRYFSKRSLKLEKLQERTQKDIDRFRGKHSVKEFKDVMNWISHQKRKSVVVTVGEDGPMAPVYKELIIGWKGAVTSSDDPLELDLLLETLCSMEKSIVEGTSVGGKVRSKKS